jgi:hypothetical protein
VRTGGSTLTAKRQALAWLQPCRDSCAVGQFELDYVLRTRPAVSPLQICVKPLRRTVDETGSPSPPASPRENISWALVYTHAHPMKIGVRAGIRCSALASRGQQMMMETKWNPVSPAGASTSFATSNMAAAWPASQCTVLLHQRQTPGAVYFPLCLFLSLLAQTARPSALGPSERCPFLNRTARGRDRQLRAVKALGSHPPDLHHGVGIDLCGLAYLLM